MIGLDGPVIHGIRHRRGAVDGADGAGRAAGDVIELALERGVVAGAHVLRRDGEQAASVFRAGQRNEAHRSRTRWYVWPRHMISSRAWSRPTWALTISHRRSHVPANCRAWAGCPAYRRTASWRIIATSPPCGIPARRAIAGRSDVAGAMPGIGVDSRK